jgi:hypothetical protein
MSVTSTPRIGFTLFDLQPGDLVIADRGYCRRRQLAYVLLGGAQLVVRLAVHQLPLLDEHGQPFDVLTWLKAQGSGQHQCLVAFEQEGRRFTGRLIARSLPEEEAPRARDKERKKAEKQATSPQRGDALPVRLALALHQLIGQCLV